MMHAQSRRLLFAVAVRGKLAFDRRIREINDAAADSFLADIVANLAHKWNEAATDTQALLFRLREFRDPAILCRVYWFIDHVAELGDEHAEHANSWRVRLAGVLVGMEEYL